MVRMKIKIPKLNLPILPTLRIKKLGINWKDLLNHSLTIYSA